MRATDQTIIRWMIRAIDAAPKFEEGKHPRGQPENAGQFAKTAGAGKKQPTASREPEKGHAERNPSKSESSNPYRQAAADAEKRLKTAEPKSVIDFPVPKGRPKSKNVVQLVKLADGSSAVFKPRSGSYRAKIKGRQVLDTEKEIGTWELAKLMGLDDLVAPAVRRTIKGEDGTLFAFQKGTIAANAPAKKQYDGEEDLPRAAMFDYITGNNDRHGGNWLVDGDKLRLIDHDRSFPEWHKGGALENGYASLMEEAALRQTYKDGGWDDEPDIGPIQEFAKPYLENKPKILKLLQQNGIPPAAINAVGKRIDRLKTTKDWKALKYSPKDYQ